MRTRYLLTAMIAALCLAFGDAVSAAGISASAVPIDAVTAFDWLGAAVVGVTLGTGALTLADWAKRVDPDGKIKVRAIVELLMQSNEILEDMSFREGNLPTGHRTTVRTGLPTVAWRLLNAGITPSKSSTAQIDEQAGILEAWSEVDKDLAELNADLSAFRLSEARAFIEAMNQEMASTVFYGNGGLAPEEFTGLAPRFSDSTAANGDNVILADAAAAGATQTSIWLVAWGEETVCGIFPKGSTAGLQHNDYGEVTVEVTAGVAGQRMRAYQERWQWKAGIAVKDWRYVVRGQIDTGDLAGGTPPDLVDLMEEMQEKLPNRLGGPGVFYMNRRLRRHLRKQAREDVTSGGGLTFENFAGKRVMMFGDSPIRTIDALLNTEDAVAT